MFLSSESFLVYVHYSDQFSDGGKHSTERPKIWTRGSYLDSDYPQQASYFIHNFSISLQTVRQT